MYKISVTPEEIEVLPLTSCPGTIQVIDEPGKEYDDAIAYLKRQKYIGFDTESRPCFAPTQHHYGVALLQLSGARKSFLFRVKRLGMTKELCKILASESHLKIGAATGEDVRGLQKYCGFEPKGFVDLQKIVWEYGIKDKSVKKMSAIILGIKISKKEQLSNWEAETLSEAQRKYAATDAWVCREMYLKLLESDKNPLTPEQMLPNPPKVAPEAQAAPADATTSAKKKKRRRKHKPSGVGSAEHTTASSASQDTNSASQDAESAAKKKRRRNKRRYYQRKRAKQKANDDNSTHNTQERQG